MLHSKCSLCDTSTRSWNAGVPLRVRWLPPPQPFWESCPDPGRACTLNTFPYFKLNVKQYLTYVFYWTYKSLCYSKRIVQPVSSSRTHLELNIITWWINTCSPKIFLIHLWSRQLFCHQCRYHSHRWDIYLKSDNLLIFLGLPVEHWWKLER